MTITLRVQPHYFSAIASGKKCVEGRLRKPNLASLHVGERIIFENHANADETLQAKITFLHEYTSFQEMLVSEGVEKCLPGISSLEQALAIYHSFPGYKENESAGVLALGIQLQESPCLRCRL